MKVDGRCHCGEITYEADVDPERVIVCHCTDCQVLGGTAFRTSVPVSIGDFRLLSGTPRIYVKLAESGNRRAQAFCSTCGTSLYSADAHEPKTVALRTSAMQQRAALPPRRQIWHRSAMPWALELDRLTHTDRG